MLCAQALPFCRGPGDVDEQSRRPPVPAGLTCECHRGHNAFKENSASARRETQTSTLKPQNDGIQENVLHEGRRRKFQSFLLVSHIIQVPFRKARCQFSWHLPRQAGTPGAMWAAVTRVLQQRGGSRQGAEQTKAMAASRDSCFRVCLMPAS